MKILNIYFKNINSLEGESRIHFDRVPISESGVFAITGPNGSGKSSILDVITLALYGETFRFDRPADHVITKATTESFAEVEFSLGEDSYRSSWHVKREKGKSTGAILAPQMKLLQLNGTEQLIEDSAQRVRGLVAELTGMDFHKFSKSMVLAQGDFSAFLNALDTERMDILEKISGTDIYHNHIQQAEESNTLAQTQLNNLEQDLNAIPITDEASREASEMDLADFQEQHAEFKQEYEEIHQQLVSIQRIEHLESQAELQAHQQELVDAQLDENQKKLDEIDEMQAVKGVEEDLKVLDNKVEETLQSKKTLDAYRSELKLLQSQLNTNDLDETIADNNKTVSQQKNKLEEVKTKLTEQKTVLTTEKTSVQSMNRQVVENKTALTDAKSWLEEHVIDQSLQDDFPELSRLFKLKEELAEVSEQQESYLKRSKITEEGLKKAKADSQVLTQKSADLQKQIEVDEQLLEELSEGYSIAELQEMKTDQQGRVELFQEFNDLANVNAKLSRKGLMEQMFQPKGADREELELNLEAEQLQLEIGKEQKIIETLEAAIFNEALLLKMQRDREHLHDGKACPLCGALDHPFLKYPPAVSNSKNILTEQKKKVKSLRGNANSLEKQIVAAKKQAQIDLQKEDKLQVICSQWTSLANKLNVAGMDLEIDNLSEIKELFKAEKIELSNLNNLIKKHGKQQSSKGQAMETIELNKSALERLNKETELLDLNMSDRPGKADELDQTVSKVKLDVEKLEIKIVERLTILGEKIPAKKDMEEELIQRLTMRKQAFRSRKVHARTLAEEIQGLDKKIATSLTKIDQLSTKIEQTTRIEKQEEQAGLHLVLVEKQKLIADKERLLSQQEKESVVLKQALLKSSQTVANGDLDALRKSVKLVNGRTNILQTRLELTQRVNKIWKSRELTQAELDREKSVLISNKTADELLTLDKSIREKLHIAKQEVESVQNKLSKQKVIQEKYDAIFQKVKDQKVITQASEKEIAFISDDNGIHFRHKVQQGMADKLLSESNQVLEKISGRYYIRKVESEHGLALEIEDTKQKNIRRQPKTLSGGESFIVSLALALGLAEMANNGHALDSLFLDEGFGNLDAEALYLVMTTLESLKTHGKTVGVISHVEGVRKRIKTQVKMIRKPNGMSALKVIS